MASSVSPAPGILIGTAAEPPLRRSVIRQLKSTEVPRPVLEPFIGENPTGYSRDNDKKPICGRLGPDHGSDQAGKRTISEAVLETLTAALKAGERIDWRGFGVFKVREAKARQARNPRTGEMVAVPAKRWLPLSLARSLPLLNQERRARRLGTLASMRFRR